MPFFEGESLRTWYTLEGAANAPMVALSHSLGVASAMWEPQMARLQESFRVLRWDTRGHGRSGVPAGEYTTAQLGQDVVNLLDHLESERVHFCGLSMGGMVGQWLALHAPHRLLSLTLANTAARIGTAETWNARIQTVREQGMEAIVKPVLERWFTPSARRNAALIEPVKAMLRATSPVGYVGCCAAIREMDLRVGIASITTPTLVIAGLSDLVTPLADAQFLANQISGARLTELRAAHLSNVESAGPFTEALLQFWGADPARAGDSAPQWPPR